ncbi:alpha/beta hydrolase [Robbsia sp. KACC 23696]|uniref:alpha/beta fold hydrolase n=1 Tax=Robbsia sp. KACC 23696 TaxID=3149231 RepID=UPI00325B2656
MKSQAQPQLDHESRAFKLAMAAEVALLREYGLSAKSIWLKEPSYGLRVRITEIGEGRPVFVLPGNTGDMFPFIPLLSQLNGYKCYLLNRPGGGLSDGFDHQAVDLRDFVIKLMDYVLEALGFDAGSFIAHSMGCHWLLWYAMARPKVVRRQVLIGNPGRVMLPKTPTLLRLALLPYVGELAIGRIIPTSRKNAFRGLKAMGTRQHELDVLPQAFAECYYQFQNLPNYKTSTLSLLRAMNRRAENFLSATELTAVNADTLMLWGRNDTFATVEQGRAIAKALGADFSIIPDAGHMPWLDEPLQCAQVIEKFIGVSASNSVDVDRIAESAKCNVQKLP